MIDFYEYIAKSRRIALPDSHTMLSMAAVPLDVPNEEETKRLLNRDKKRQLASGNATRISTSKSFKGDLKAPAG